LREFAKKTSKPRSAGADIERTMASVMSRLEHQTAKSRGRDGRSAALTKPIRMQMTDRGVVSAKWRQMASPQTLVEP